MQDTRAEGIGLQREGSGHRHDRREEEEISRVMSALTVHISETHLYGCAVADEQKITRMIMPDLPAEL